MDVVTGAVVNDVVTGAVGSLISKLRQLLNEEYKLQKNARKKLKSLIKELECAQAALRKVDRVPLDELDEQVRIWAREVRDASYDMEDIIDTFVVRIEGGHKEHSSGHKSFLKGLIRNLFERRKISGAMDDIKKRLEDVRQRYGRYTVVDKITVARPASLDPRLAAMYKEVSELVGIEKSSSELMAMLSPLGHNEQTEVKMKMVSVVGIGGLGKTTLVKSVYDKLKVDFDCSAFVPVGRNPDLKKVFRDILIGIDKDKYMDHNLTILDERQLIDELREKLGNKRHLLVIDDIWEKESWETIKLALVQKNSGSRVITTTRILEVAKEAGEVYKLQQLPYDKSKKLFCTRLSAEGKCQVNQPDEVFDKILKKCDGVPLAIITMASLLVHKLREEWTEVCNSIAFRDKYNKQVSNTEWILSLSYYDLPPHLKTCLLYLSVFPEDQLIRKDSLIWKWLAEGFVHSNKPGTRLFEVGNIYFNELINRSMIQAVEDSDGMVFGCRVHDMVLDLLRQKSQEENFVTVSRSNKVEVTSSTSRARRLSHQNQNKMVEHTQMDIGHVRSFIAYWCDIDEEISFRSFKLLRVLALEHCSNHGSDTCSITLTGLNNLLHLRYLGLGFSSVHEIPEEIGALKFLQTLDLEETIVLQNRLPSSLGMLSQLICLRARFMEVPNGVIEKLTSLEQLEICASDDTVGHFVKDLDKLRELRVLYAELGALDHSMQRDLMDTLRNLHKLQHLELIPFKYRYDQIPDKSMRETGALPRPLQCLIVQNLRFSELPSCISPSGLPNITYLNLMVDYMEDQHLKFLGQLPQLGYLELTIKSYDSAAKVTVTSTDGFQKLRYLSLLRLTVQFVPNENSTVSFITVGESRTMDFGTKKGDKCIVAPAVMPNLHVLVFWVYLKSGVNNGILLCDNLGLDCVPSLQSVEVHLFPGGISAHDMEIEEAALRKAIEVHPNRPTLKVW